MSTTTGSKTPTASQQRPTPRGVAAVVPRGLTGPAVDKPGDSRGTARQVLRMLQPERLLITAAASLAAVSVTLTVLGPRILGEATNLVVTGVVGRSLRPGTTKAEAIRALRRQGHRTLAEMISSMNVVPGHGIDFSRVSLVLLTALLFFVTAGLLAWLQGRLASVLLQRAMFRLRGQAEAKLARLPLSYFDRQPRGELLSRVTNDLDNLGQTLQQTLSQVLTALLTIIGVLVMMLLISPLLALAALVTVPASMYAAARISKRAKPQFLDQWTTTGQLNSHVEEAYTGHSLIKLFGREQETAQTFHEQNASLYQSSFKAQVLAGMTRPVTMLLGNINYVIVAVVGGIQVASGTLSLGSVQAFIQYSGQFGQPVNQLASISSLLQSGLASAERVFSLLDAPEESSDPVHPRRLAQAGGRIEFENVSFTYNPDTPLIENLSLTVQPGQTVAIVGPTGAGKTTLVNLLMRFYEPTAGRITLDGVDIADMTRADVRAKIGIVLQDAWVLGDTIERNIAFGAADATHEQVVAAARATYVDHFVRTLPAGYDTILQDEGAGVSAGERQLITIARAFLAQPSILILDEATSSVDTRTELLIRRAMDSLRAGRTSFVIAHRLSTIRDAALILVMESGQIVERGTHEELLAAGGAYARLYQSQFAQPVATAS